MAIGFLCPIVVMIIGFALQLHVELRRRHRRVIGMQVSDLPLLEHADATMEDRV